MSLSREQRERARLMFSAICEFRKNYEPCGFKQALIAEMTGIPQPTISKVLNGQIDPSEDQLTRLFEALGLRLDNVLSDWRPKDRLVGYLATPLTGIAANSAESEELERVVRQIRGSTAGGEFTNPTIDLYWPGEHTHPTRNPDISPDMVYRTDRSRASTYDFIVLLCCDPSYGVGQENEIATQAGIPAIRLMPDNISRMLRGSFLMAHDVNYSGTLRTGIKFDLDRFHEALRWVKRTVIMQHALFGASKQAGFGHRLRRLLDDRVGDYSSFASELGIGLSYLHSLMDEPFPMANPSARLLQRMSHRLGVSISYLLGEDPEMDPVYAESVGNWNRWLASSNALDDMIANSVRASWEQEHVMSTKEAAIGASHRNKRVVLSVTDWDKRYQQAFKEVQNNGHAKSPSLFDQQQR
jgi:transcriptional regulator with XRE-family HTH domain